MKVICIGRNYVDHARELGNAIPSEPVVFMKPSTAVLANDKPFFHPGFSSDIHFECELVLRICRNGKAIEERFAHRYYDAMTLGIDFTARDLQDELKGAGLPWEKAKAFDHSAAVGTFIPKEELPPADRINFQLSRNGEVVQSGDTTQLLFGCDRIVADVSKYFRLLNGDLIFTGTPAGVARIARNDLFTGVLEGREVLRCRVK